MIDLYCERLTADLWAEPLNALSNLAFFIAAYYGWRRGARLLALIVLLIGIGSALFHTFATPLTQAMDVLPILVFQLCFLYLYAARALKLQISAIAGLFGLYIGATAIADALPGYFNGSISYAPALLFLIVLGLMRRQLPGRNWLLLAAGVFVLSLTFRSLDNAVCEALPIGLHYMWHMLNAVVLYLCMKAYVQDKAS